MIKSKHTPGPWEVFDNGLLLVEKEGHPICGCGTSFIGNGGECAVWQVERNKANANLIAAAPDMLDALEDCCVIAKPENQACCCPVYRPGEHGGCAENEDGECHIWKAIQKARAGE